MKKILASLLVMVLMLTMLPLGAVSVSAATTEVAILDNTGLNADFVFLANNYPQYLDNDNERQFTDSCLKLCNDILQDYDEKDTWLLAYAECFVNGTGILIQELGSKLGITQSVEEEWLQKNTMEYLRLVGGCEDIIYDEWNKVAKKYKDFKFVLKNVDELDTELINEQKNLFIKEMSDYSSCFSEEEIAEIADALIDKEPNGIKKFFSKADRVVDLADTLLLSCQMAEVEDAVLKRLRKNVGSNTTLYRGITSVLEANAKHPARWVLEKYLSDQALDWIEKQLTDAAWDWSAGLLGVENLNVATLVVEITATVLYNYVYQGAKIDEIYGAWVAYDFYSTVSSSLMQQHITFYQCKTDNRVVPEQALLDYFFLYEAKRIAMLHYTEACINIDKCGYSPALEHNQTFYEDDGELAFDKHIARCMKQLKADIDAGKVTVENTHTVHNYSTYVYYEAKHPHYKCYQCLCGDVKADDSEPTFVSGCSSCSQSRDDGTWLFPLPKSYYNHFSDWAGCPGNDKCLFCGVYHSAWGDSAHTGQGGHNGFDVAAPTGTQVYAAASGTAYSFYNSARGNTVVIEHPIGNGYSYYTYYQHLSSAAVSNGTTVTVGQTIGKVGNTGASAGSHLHFGMVMGVSGQKGSSSLLNSLEGCGWITTTGYRSGRILNNPASTNDAGFPTGNSAVVPPLKAHYGSTHYTFDVSKVSIGVSEPTPTTSYGTYYIKNHGTGLYLDVSQGQDVQLRNILVWAFNGGDNQKFEVTESTTTAGYAMRPLSSISRKVNVEADTVVSGKNVCIYDDTGHDSQRWNFEKVNGGYVIRNVQNPNCVLDVEDGENVYVSTYTGAVTQIWTFQDVNCTHTYDNACDATCNSCGMDRSVSGHNWVDATCTAAKVCINCGATEGAALGHNWTDATCTTPTTCSVCGETDGASLGHDWDITTGYCTICGQSASEEYSEWLEELPADITEDLFDIENKTVYRYRNNSSHISYGEWSSEQTTSTKPTESDTLTIVSTTTYYNYYHYCCNYYSGSYNVDSIPYGSGGQYHTIRLTYELSPKNVGDKGGKTLYGSCTCSKGFNVWAKADQYITYEYKYKTRTATNVVDYGAWTDWSDTAPSAAANRDIETKTLYRYKLKHVHTWADATCTTPKTCTTCGTTAGDALGHAYSSAVTKAPTCTAAGMKTYTCSTCKHSYTEVLPATGEHSYDNDSDVDCNECGAIREVVSATPGDANGDGNNNNRDLAFLQQYINKWDVPIDVDAMDVNNDGAVNNRDLALLQQYINKWDVELQ